MKKRIRISAAYSGFIRDIKKYRAFDRDNQTKFSAGEITKDQFNMLTETVFFNAYRAYESCVRDIFLLYTQEKQRSDGTIPKSYLKPKDIFHAEKMIRSGQRFLDWDPPDKIITRSELYLRNDIKFKVVYSANISTLLNYKKIRNHIAHYSTESLEEYKKVLKAHYGVVPLNIPLAGEFLNQTSKTNRTQNIIEEFFSLIESIISYVK